MSAKALFLSVLVALVGLGAAAIEKKAAEEDGRLFFTGLTGTDDGQNITLGGNALIFLGLVLTTLIAAVIVLGVLLGVGPSLFKRFDDDYGYSSPSYYSSYSGPNSRESSYAVHRTLEDAARKFEE
ncbi:uncharacterized protein LOC123505833 [Portunus trituberculatus]|uniref:uncharacterized protein LOC123505833 n=1 Tax=Portunus trituberculatus TaxID=210409 RepID=UPI001E1CEEE5|nr:uncharacterized protein LOC123505833 [Portunus trituberculatus]